MSGLPRRIFAAALWLLRAPGFDAPRDMPALICAYNESVGVRNTAHSGYHETITQTSLRLARAWLNARREASLAQVLESLLTSPYGRSDWPLRYWSQPRLFSPAARRAWLAPDLQPLPF